MAKIRNPIAAKIVESVERGPVAAFLKANGGPGYKAKRGEDSIPWSMALEMMGACADQAVDMAFAMVRNDPDWPRGNAPKADDKPSNG